MSSKSPFIWEGHFLNSKFSNNPVVRKTLITGLPLKHTGRRGMEMGKGNGGGDADADGDGEAGKDIEHPFITQWGYAGHIKSIWVVRAGAMRVAGAQGGGWRGEGTCSLCS